jgi:single-strand DNA-binding protein
LLILTRNLNERIIIGTDIFLSVEQVRGAEVLLSIDAPAGTQIQRTKNINVEARYMAKGINKVILIGNVGQDLSVRYTPQGVAALEFTLATGDSVKDKATGDYKDVTDWHTIKMIGRLAEITSEYAEKGTKLYIEGRLKHEKFKDKSGNDRVKTKVYCHEMQLLGSRKQGTTQPEQTSFTDHGAPFPEEEADDSIPF